MVGLCALFNPQFHINLQNNYGICSRTQHSSFIHPPSTNLPAPAFVRSSQGYYICLTYSTPCAKKLYEAGACKGSLHGCLDSPCLTEGSTTTLTCRVRYLGRLGIVKLTFVMFLGILGSSLTARLASGSSRNRQAHLINVSGYFW